MKACNREQSQNPKKNKASIGRAGEFLVAAQLERHGFTATMAHVNAKGYDILAVHRDTGALRAIQVKTTTGGSRKWLLHKKNEAIRDKEVFYVFVSGFEGTAPEFHVVPSETVAEFIEKDHKKWLSRPGRNGQQHNDADTRNFRIEETDDQYRNNWDQLMGSRA